MQLFWFLAGVLTTIAVTALAYPWLRTLSPPSTLTSTPVRACLSAAVLVAAIAGLYEGLGRPHESTSSPPPFASGSEQNGASRASMSPTSFGAAADAAAKTFGDAAGASAGGARIPGTAANAAAPTASAGSMDSAVANLRARLAKGGGTPGDWDLLAKSYEFLGRPEDAAKARAHQMPAGAALGPAAAASVSVSGEVTLDASLRGKVSAGDTLFILAKSVDSPGAPVAVIRGAVGAWPLEFTLDDSQSMMPGRSLSSAGRVTVEARISKKGQPLAAPGDLQGSSGAIDPAAGKPLRIKIDRIIG
jgi:hypothetical protein